MSNLCVLESQTGPRDQHIEKPVDPFRITATLYINGLQRLHPLNRFPDSAVVLIDRITAQHPEDRNIDLPLLCLSGHIRIHLAGIVGLIPITAPQGISVSSDLIAAVAGGNYRVVVGHILQRMRIDKPRPHGSRIRPEDLFKLTHVRVDQDLPFLSGITRREAHIGVPVPRILSPPLHTGRFDMGLGNLPPSAYFTSGRNRLAHQFLIARIDQCVVLQQERSPQIIFFHQLELRSRCLIEVVIRNIHRSRFRLPDKIDDIHDSR